MSRRRIVSNAEAAAWRCPNGCPRTPATTYEHRNGRPACRPCTSAAAKRAWAEGRHRKRNGLNPARWRPEEEDALRALQGRPLEEIAATLNARFGTARTPGAVGFRLGKLGLPTRIAGFSSLALARLFGLEVGTLRGRWLATGLLTSRRAPIHRTTLRKHKSTRGLRPAWRIDAAEVERFLRAYPWEYDWRAMDQRHPLTALARAVQMRQPYLTMQQAARTCGVDTPTVSRWIAEGRLPGARLRTSGVRGFVGRSWMIPPADLAGVTRYRPPAVPRGCPFGHADLVTESSQRAGRMWLRVLACTTCRRQEAAS